MRCGEWIDTDSAAFWIGIPEEQVRRLLRRGELAGYREKRAWRICAEGLEAYFQKVGRAAGSFDSELARVLVGNGVKTGSLHTLPGSEGEPIHVLVVPGAGAMRAWKKLRALVGETGHWPAILGGEWNLQAHLNILQSRNQARSAAEIIRIGERKDAREVLGGLRWPTNEEHHVQVGEWPRRAWRRSRFRIPFDWRDVPEKRRLAAGPSEEIVAPLIAIGLFSTRSFWHVPAFLRYGGWNCNPEAEDHVCILRYWGERYGAELVGIALDTVEMSVSRPPAGRAAALELAREQFLYADMSDCGFRTGSELAATLIRAKLWHFWWD